MCLLRKITYGEFSEFVQDKKVYIMKYHFQFQNLLNQNLIQKLKNHNNLHFKLKLRNWKECSPPLLTCTRMNWKCVNKYNPWVKIPKKFHFHRTKMHFFYIFKSTKTYFLLFQKWQKIQFYKKKSLKLWKMQFLDWKKDMIFGLKLYIFSRFRS